MSRVVSTITHTPVYGLHKASGHAIVRLNGRDHYLGKFGTPESREAYHRLIAEWMSSKRRLPTKEVNGTEGRTAVNDIILSYWRHAGEYYRDVDGNPTSEISNLKPLLGRLKKMYGHTPADDFNSLCLEALREQMIQDGLCRTRINRDISRIKRVFKWAVSKMLVPVAVHQLLTTVDGLRTSRSRAKESQPVRPVADSVIEATVLYTSPTVRAMIQVQRLSACRPGEVVIMRGCDLETSGRVWIYRPRRHKGQYRGRTREIYLGPRCQEIIRPFLKLDMSAYLFSPADAERARNHERRLNRKSPMTPSQAARVPKQNRKRPPQDRYTVDSYRRAIARACNLAFPFPQPAGLSRDEAKKWCLVHALEIEKWQKEHQWCPLQIRHTSATSIRKQFGLEASCVVLGHSEVETTQIYAERNQEQAMEIIEKVG